MGIELSLFKLADILQIPLDLSASKKISGSAEGTFITSVGAPLVITPSATKLFHNDQCGILAHIRGDLHLVASHYPATGAISAYLIDGDKLFMDGIKAPPELFISKVYSIREVYEAYKKAIVAAFAWKGDCWKPLKLPT